VLVFLNGVLAAEEPIFSLTQCCEVNYGFWFLLRDAAIKFDVLLIHIRYM